MGLPATPVSETALRLRLDELENRLQGADAAYAHAQWRRHLGPTNGIELGWLESARSVLLTAAETQSLLREWEDRPRDPLLARRVTLLLRRSNWAGIESQPQVYQLRNRIDQAMVDFKPRVAGTTISRVERSQALRYDPDRRRRREAWLATGPLADEIETDVRRLMAHRQALARRQGYDGFVSWALETIGLDRRWVEAVFSEILRRTDASYHAWLADIVGRLSLKDGLRPWDLAFASDQELTPCEVPFVHTDSLAAAGLLAGGLGLGEVAAGVQVDVVDVPFGALCYAIRPPDDVRILLRPQNGRVQHDVLFHEFGHALHWRGMGPLSPALRCESSAFNEAMACLWERLAFEPEWAMVQGEVGPEQVAIYRRAWARRAIYRLRLRIAQATFEYRAYDALGDDLLALQRDVFTQHLAVPYDEVPGWSDNPFWTSHPIYLQNYVIGEAVASQTLAALRRRFGRLIGERQVGGWLVTHYYAPGASLPWREKVHAATGAPLSCTDLATDLGC